MAKTKAKTIGNATLTSATNLVFYERTTLIEIDCHYVKAKVLGGEITTYFVKSEDQLTFMFTMLSRTLEWIAFVTSLTHLTYMIRLEGSVANPLELIRID
jgi:hypothetical protein